MALTDRDIIITPNRGASSEPIITLRGADAASSATMVMRVTNSSTVSTLSFEGTSGQLFAVSDTLTGSIFSVNDVSGIPSIEVLDSGIIKLAEYNGKVLIGGATNNENATSATTGELQVTGGVGISRDVYVAGGMTVVGTLNAAVIAGSISNSANVAVTNDPSNSATMYPTFVSATSGNQAIRVDSSGLVWIPSTNRLGIGTASPTSRLHVAGPGNVTGGNIHLGDDVNGTAKWTYITGAHFNGATNPTGFSLIGGLSESGANRVVIGGNIYESNPATEIQFWTHTATTHSTGGSQRMVIDTNGNVGINTTAPATKLHILKGAPSGVTSVPSDTDLLIDSNTNSYLTFRQSADIGVYGGIQWVDNNVGAYIVFRNYTGSVAAGSDSIIYGTYQDHIFQAGTSGTVNGKTEVARITSAGRLGIGTNAPDIPLDVRGTDATIQAREDGTSSAWRARILSRNASSDKSAFLGNYASITGVFAHNYSLGAWAPLYVNTTNGSGDGANVIIAGSGNVGIGNNAPGRKLDVTGVTNISSHITQGALISRPNVSWGASGNSTGAVVIKFPGGSGNYGMVHIVIDIYTYDGENASTIIIGGHNWNGAWYNFGATRIGAFSKGVRVAFKDGQYAVVLGTNTSTWSYGQVVVRKIQNGSYYSGIMDLGGTYTIAQDAAAESYSWISSNLITAGSAAGGGWNSGNDGSGSGLDADLLDGLDSTAFLRRDVSNTMFSGQTSALSFENQTTFFRFAFNDLRFYDWNNGYDIFGLNDYAYATTSMRAPIFYDSNDTTYYLDPNADLSLRVYGEISNSNYVPGNLQPGALNIGRTDRDYGWDGTSWSGDVRAGILANCSELWEFVIHDSGDSVESVFRYNGGDQLLMGRDIGWGTLYIEAASSFRAPIFYDSNDTGFYLDPASTTTSLNMAGSVRQANYNKPGILTVASGSASTGASFAIQQETSEGWTGIFVDYEPNTGWGLYHDNPNNLFSFTAEAATGQIRSFTVPSRVSGNRTAYEKFRVDQNNGDIIVGRDGYAQSSFRAPIFYDSNNTGYYVDPASTTVLNNLTINGTLSATVSGGSDFARRIDNATRTAISVGGNASTFYPVVLQIGAGATSQQYGEFVLERGGYDDPGYTGVNFSTFNMRMTVKASGWGFGSTYENCESLYQNVQLVANWQQVSESSRLIIWLRGATVYYLWNVVGNTTLVNANAAGGNIVESNPAYYTYTFTPTTTIQPKAQHSKYFNNGTMSDGSSRISSLGIGTNASGTDGRLDVTSDVRAPIYYDSNNTGYYTDPASTSVLNTLRVPNATSGWSLMVGQNTTTGIYADNDRYGVAINAPYYPHLYLTSTTDGGNPTHGPVISLQGIKTAGGFRKWNIGIANRNPDELSFGWYDNDSNPHYGVGINWSYPASMWIDTGHNLHARGSMRAPIFYDRDDTGYYADPASTTRLNRLYINQRNDNYNVGSMNPTNAVSDWQSLTNTTGQWTVSQFNAIGNYSNSPSTVYTYGSVMSWRTDNHSFQLYAAHTGDLAYKTQWNNDNYSGWLYPMVYNRSTGAGAVYGTIYYDANDTAYYVDPNSNSRFAGSITISQNNSTGGGIILADDGDIVDLNDGYCAMRFSLGVRVHTGNRTGGAVHTLHSDGNAYHNTSCRAPIFYDNNDTAWYVDPASTSRMRNIDVASGTQTANYYDAAIEIREFNFGGVQADIWENAPRLGFHWGGRVASSIAMSSNGWINIMNNPGTGWENLRANQGLFNNEVTAYYSDVRLKTKVGTLDNALEKVKAIETFKYVNNELANSLGFTDTLVHVGVSAQSVEAVFPEVVRHAPFDIKVQDGKEISESGEWYKTVQYDKLVPLLIEAIKEQQAIIEQHRAELDELRELKELVKQSLGK